MSRLDERPDGLRHRADEVADDVPASERRVGPGVLLADGDEQFVDALRERHHPQPPVPAEIPLHDPPRQALADELRQHGRVARLAGVDGQRLQDRLQVADAHPLAQEVLQDLLQLPGAEETRHDLVHERRRRRPRPVEQSPDLLAGHQLVGVPEHDLAEVPGDDRRRLDDPAPRGHGDLAAVRVNPDARLARDGVDAVAALGSRDEPRGRHGQQSPGVCGALADDGAADLEPVFVRADADLVADADLRHDQAEVLRHAVADRADTIEQVAAAGRVGQADEAEADLQLERVDVQQVVHPLDRRLGRRRRLGLGVGLVDVGGVRRSDQIRPQAQCGGEREHRHHRHPGERQQREESGRDAEHGRAAEQLADDLAPQVGRLARPRDDQPRRQGDQERRDLAHEAVADRQLGEDLDSLRGRHPVLHDPEEQPRADVDQGDDDARDRIAPDELPSAIHRAEEVGLAVDVLTASVGLVLVDQAGVEVGVDRHLPARHAVEHEPRGDLADPRRPLGDDDELDHEDDREQDHADDHLVSRDELAEGADDAAGRVGPGDAGAGEREPRRGDVEHEPRQRRRQEDRGEGAEFQGRADRERRQQDEHGERDVGGQEEVEHARRDRHDEDQQRPHERDRQDRARQARPSGGGGTGGRGGHPFHSSCASSRCDEGGRSTAPRPCRAPTGRRGSFEMSIGCAAGRYPGGPRVSRPIGLI